MRTAMKNIGTGLSTVVFFGACYYFAFTEPDDDTGRRAVLIAGGMGAAAVVLLIVRRFREPAKAPGASSRLLGAALAGVLAVMGGLLVRMGGTVPGVLWGAVSAGFVAAGFAYMVIGDPNASPPDE